MSRSALRASEHRAVGSRQAFELACRYLARRERTVSEVREHLLGRGIDQAAAMIAIEDLVEQGLLDDARFARLFVEDKRELEQWGSERIRRALLVRGIDREVVDAALGLAASGEGDELVRALGLLHHRFPVPPQGRRERERALGLLLRKGYEPELALEALYAHRRQAA